MNKEIGAEDAKREKRLVVQFTLTGLTWIIEILIFTLLQWFPVLRGPWINVYSELARYFAFCIDPIIYTVFMKDLRRKLKAKLLGVKKIATVWAKGTASEAPAHVPSHVAMGNRAQPRGVHFSGGTTAQQVVQVI